MCLSRDSDFFKISGQMTQAYHKSEGLPQDNRFSPFGSIVLQNYDPTDVFIYPSHTCILVSNILTCITLRRSISFLQSCLALASIISNI